MNTKLKILLTAILFTMVLTREKICDHLGFGQAKLHGAHIATKKVLEPTKIKAAEINNYFVNDSLYHWSEQLLKWIPEKEKIGNQAKLVTYNKVVLSTKEPIKIAWEVLMDIRYRLRYFSELDTEIYAPVFPETIKALDGKKVIIEGFVIPFDEELLSLSYNPYTSCFFCGKASPASVMSMDMKEKRQHIRMDDFKKFSGTLHLNYDDPNEFYYILRDAKEE